MKRFGLFRYLEPCFCAGLLDDPLLLINVRPTGRSILFDCGRIHHLAKRILRSLDAVFISHAHMDHFMGFDQLLRNVHVAPRTIRIYGPPGIADRVEHKLSGYDWNLVEESWCTFRVCEIHPDRLDRYHFPGRRGFNRSGLETTSRPDRVVYRTPYLSVAAELCDHRLPALIFRVTERESFLLDRKRMEAAGLVPGPWLRELQKRFHAGDWGDEPVLAWQKAGSGHRECRHDDARALFASIRRTTPPASVGYISDLGMTDDNLARILSLLDGVTLLVSECTFLAADEAKARASFHLCTSDLNRITREIGPDHLLPMHLSKAYIDDTRRLFAELSPPPGTRLLQLPAYLTPRPLLPDEFTPPTAADPTGTD